MMGPFLISLKTSVEFIEWLVKFTFLKHSIKFMNVLNNIFYPYPWRAFTFHPGNFIHIIDNDKKIDFSKSMISYCYWVDVPS